MHCNTAPEHAESEGREGIPSHGTPALFNAVESHHLCALAFPGPRRASALVLCCIFGIRRWQEQCRLIPVMTTANAFPASGHTFPLHRSGCGQIFIICFFFSLLLFVRQNIPRMWLLPSCLKMALQHLTNRCRSCSWQQWQKGAGSRRGARAVHNLPMQGKAGGAGG